MCRPETFGTWWTVETVDMWQNFINCTLCWLHWGQFFSKKYCID